MLQFQSVDAVFCLLLGERCFHAASATGIFLRGAVQTGLDPPKIINRMFYTVGQKNCTLSIVKSLSILIFFGAHTH